MGAPRLHGCGEYACVRHARFVRSVHTIESAGARFHFTTVGPIAAVRKVRNPLIQQSITQFKYED